MNICNASAPSDIGVRQNTPAMLCLLRARQWRWKVAERWQKAQIAVVLAAPMLALSLGTIIVEARPWISLIAVCLAITDAAWIDRSYKEALKAAAKASELFDITLMHLSWNALAAGKRPAPEETDCASRGWERLRNPYPIENWYSSEVDRAPLPLARAICQRTNLSYDADLRRMYRALLACAAILIVILVFALGLTSSRTFSEWVLAAFVPAGPFVAWVLRERIRQADAVNANEAVLAEAERLIEDVIAGRLNDASAQARSREVQNAIYSGRARTVLLLPGIYMLRRNDAEQRMHAGAKYWLEKAGLLPSTSPGSSAA